MPKIYLDEVEAMNSSTLVSTLKNDSTDSANVNNSVVLFADTKDKLSGPQWDKVRSKFAEYSNALDKRTAVAEKLSDAIETALNLLIEYLGDDLMLDSSMLGEYESQKRTCKNSIDKLYAMLEEMETVKVTDSNGKTSEVTRHKYDQSTIKKQISSAEAVLDELQRLIDKINGLEAICEQAVGILEPVFSEITEYGNIVSSITPSSKVVYNGS